MLWLYIFIFIISIFLLYIAGNLLIGSLIRAAKFLGWREFVVAFFTMSIAASIPNLFVGLSSAAHGIPQLSFGDVVGGNLVDLTIVVALAALAAGGITSQSRLIQTSAIFTAVIAVLPLLLIFDGKLGRGDGVLLIIVFFLYTLWLFSKQERFSKVYNDRQITRPIKQFRAFIKDVGKIMLGIGIMIVAAEGIVRSAHFFAEAFSLPLTLIGILVVGLGNALPEAYFAFASARKGQTWMILGDLMGSVITAATLVLGIVAILSPIVIPDFSPFAVARFFLIISAIFFYFIVRTDHKISKKEALFLLTIYVIFVLIEIFIK